MGSNHIITTGPISDQALLGPTLKVKDYAMPHASRRCAFVRISSVNHGMREDVTYPIAQCASWFGLLNKHQEIRRALERAKEKSASKTYPLKVGRQILTDKTWASLQRWESGETLRIWMETHQSPNITDTKSRAYTGSEEGRTSDTENESLIKALSASSDELNPVPVVQPFLAWRVLDEFGGMDHLMRIFPTKLQTKRFLDTIYKSLSNM